MLMLKLIFCKIYNKAFMWCWNNLKNEFPTGKIHINKLEQELGKSDTPTILTQHQTFTVVKTLLLIHLMCEYLPKSHSKE